MEELGRETSWGEIIVIGAIILISLIVSIIILISNLTALGTISKLPEIVSSVNNNDYASYGIDENGEYNCTWKEEMTGDCKMKCIKSCQLINKKSGGNVCVC
jgi:hypothetical protein